MWKLVKKVQNTISATARSVQSYYTPKIFIKKKKKRNLTKKKTEKKRKENIP